MLILFVDIFDHILKFTIVFFILFPYVLSSKTNKVWRFSMLARNFVFHAKDKRSLDMGLGGPKDHVVCFVLNSEAFGPKAAPPIPYPTSIG